MGQIKLFLFGSGEPPDFEQAVKVIIATFAVFTGFTITGYLKDYVFSPFNVERYPDWHGWVGDWHIWAFVALVALLLRYVIGSAVHLHHTYVTKVPVTINNVMWTRSRSISVGLLFMDLCFLVLFGVLAVFVTKAPDIETFMWRAIWFVAAGFAWSLTDLLRSAWSWYRGRGMRFFWAMWLCLDGLQLAATFWLLTRHAWPDPARAEVLAVVYVLFLFADLLALVRAIQLRWV